MVASDSKQQTKRKCFHGKRPVYNRIAVTKGKKEIIKQKKEFTIECTTMVVNIRRVAYVAPDMKNEAKRVIIPVATHFIQIAAVGQSLDKIIYEKRFHHHKNFPISFSFSLSP